MCPIFYTTILYYMSYYVLCIPGSEKTLSLANSSPVFRVSQASTLPSSNPPIQYAIPVSASQWVATLMHIPGKVGEQIRAIA